MPPKGGRLSDGDIGLLTRWIAEGAAWPDGVDKVTVEDPADHWSFKPLRPAPANASIDHFIDAKLAEHGLRRSPPADSATLLRRVSLDLTGLPPGAVIGNQSSVNGKLERPVTEPEWSQIIDTLLASPHYGERWAQHWLDVVRYADTHGFEVNTERPHAFPYRDYVIDAFNADLPYDRFIREQIAGDALGVDAATGFLVTASVLLPGQIGKDAPSMRLARQDSLDEIVTNIGQTFLGSAWAARDVMITSSTRQRPRLLRDAGLCRRSRIRDRELRTPAALQAKQEAEAMKREVAEIDRTLLGLVPLAGSGVTRAMVSARQNLERFAPVKAKRVRFTILSTNRLEPCIDEFEIFGESGENLALASRGVVVRSSGDTIVADRHDLKYLNDGRYGNSRSWMGNAAAGNWVEIEFPDETTIDRVLWGRDRNGQFEDRLAVGYRLEVAGWRGLEDRRRFLGPPRLRGGERKRRGISPPRGFPRPKPPRPRPCARSGTVSSARRRQRTSRFSPLPARSGSRMRSACCVAAIPSNPKTSCLPWCRRPLANSSSIPPRPSNSDVSPSPIGSRVPSIRSRRGSWSTASGRDTSGEVLLLRPMISETTACRPRIPNCSTGSRRVHRSGWSVKHLHRLIVMSETYRQAADSNREASAKDADNRLLWRFPSRGSRPRFCVIPSSR